MPTMFHQPYFTKPYHFSSDFSQPLPPRSASATSCKSPNNFLHDLSGLRSFTVRPLRSYHETEGFPAPEESDLERAQIIAPHPNKPFCPGFDLFEEDPVDTTTSERDAVPQPAQSDEELVISELLSITRPDGNSNDAADTESAEATFGDATTDLSHDGWHSRHFTQELSDLRNDITPRLFRGPSKKLSLPNPSSLRSGIPPRSGSTGPVSPVDRQ